MTIRDIDNAVRKGAIGGIYIYSAENVADPPIVLNNILRSYEGFMRMPVDSFFGIDYDVDVEGPVLCITVDAPVSVLKAWEQEG